MAKKEATKTMPEGFTYGEAMAELDYLSSIGIYGAEVQFEDPESEVN